MAGKRTKPPQQAKDDKKERDVRVAGKVLRYPGGKKGKKGWSVDLILLGGSY